MEGSDGGAAAGSGVASMLWTTGMHRGIGIYRFQPINWLQREMALSRANDATISPNFIVGCQTLFLGKI